MTRTLLQSGWSQWPLVKRSYGGLVPLFVPRQTQLFADKMGNDRIAYRGKNSFIFIKEASHLCMGIHMHGFPARFIFFTNMLIQVQALKNTNMDSRCYII